MKKLLMMVCAPFVFMFVFACSTEFLTDDDAVDVDDDGMDTTSDTVDDGGGPDVSDVTGDDGQEDEIEIPPDCGDGEVDEDEECDDGQNGDDDDGCTDACRYTCHNNAECSDDERCNGVEQCTGEHTCEDGAPEEDGYLVDEGPPRIICIEEESQESECGDGFVDTGAGEFCDPPGVDGCEDDCTRACEDNEDCPDDGNPCNGEEFCDTDAHQCDQRNPLSEGDKCDDDPRRICRGGNCQESTCGDEYLDEGGGEECDDGANGDDEDGCTDDCLYTCHNNAECSDDERCNGVEQCTEEHTCIDGDPEDDGYLVDVGPPRIICLDEVSHESECGDGFIDTGAGESCEPPGEVGCEDDCTLTCEGDDDCPDDGNPCNGEEFCDTDAHQCDQRNALEEGAVCDDTPRSICRGGTCQESTCGDLYLDEDGGEECDDGADGDDDDGCTDECTYSCHVDNDCNDGNPCNSEETCEDVDGGRACREHEWPGTGTDCNDGLFCTSDDQCNDAGECVGPTDTCDDGFDCTSDTCNEDEPECFNVVDEGYCLIGDVCRFHDFDNPDNECQYCDTYGNRSAWTNRGSGVECDQDSNFCNGVEICNGEGGCIHPGSPCVEGEVCWEDGESCCVVNSYLGCDEATGDLYYYDSCDRREERRQDCYDNPPTQNGYCDAGPPPFCACRTHWTGAFCHICPGNWDPDRDCNFCINFFDPDMDCTTCLPGYFGESCDKCRRFVSLTGDNTDGRSWATAYNSLATVLPNDCDEIWVMAGTYSVTSQLSLRHGYALYGGFDGTETSPDDRDLSANETILWGAGTDQIFWCIDSMGCSSSTRIDGFTMSNGYEVPGYGGGIYCNSADITIANCIFDGNTAQGGGALYIRECNLTVKDSIFRHNDSTNNGGAVVVHGDTSGGIYCTPYFENCLFYDNKANNRGGALYNDNYARSTLMNCTIVDNIANNGLGAGGMFGGGIMNWSSVSTSFTTLINSIVYYNQEWDSTVSMFVDSQLDQFSANTFTITYSDIMGSSCDGMGCGTGSFGLVPLFFNRPVWNYHLQNASPCIDVGTDTGAPQYDLDGVLRYDMGGIGTPGIVTDMGCFEAL